MPFLHLVAKGAQVLNAGLPIHLEGRHFANRLTADFYRTVSSITKVYSEVLLTVLLKYAIYNVYK